MGWDLLHAEGGVIVEIGSTYTKCGFTGEGVPRRILINQPYLHKLLIGEVELVQTELSAQIRSLITEVFKALYMNSDQLLVIYVLLNIYNIHEVTIKNTFNAEIRTFNTSLTEPPIYLQTQFCSLISTAQDSGLVIDIGFNETRVLPICHGKVISTALRIISIGSRNVLDKLKQMIVDENPHLTFSNALKNTSVLEDILVRICYCDPKTIYQQALLSKRVDNTPRPWPIIPSKTSSLRSPITPKHRVRSTSLKIVSSTNNPRFRSLTSPKIKQPEKIKNHLTYYCKDDERISIDVDVMRTKPLEELFKSNNEGESIMKAVYESIYSCEIDNRKLIVNNVVVCGGCSMYTGLFKRLCSELWQYAQHREGRDLFDKIRVHKTNVIQTNLMAWNGASVMVTKLSSTNTPLLGKVPQSPHSLSASPRFKKINFF
ncbi:actin-related protein [Acrasis kona]|uniref:Actin-related protein n=1 Tax=Acrasis kona TaxID=1008807 RepID=A0AAW2YGX8_9EUKA